MKIICDENEDDDTFKITDKNVEICLVCREYGTNELWFRFKSYRKWAVPKIVPKTTFVVSARLKMVHNFFFITCFSKLVI